MKIDLRDFECDVVQGRSTGWNNSQEPFDAKNAKGHRVSRDLFSKVISDKAKGRSKQFFSFLNNFEILKLGNTQRIYNLKNEVVNILSTLFFFFFFCITFVTVFDKKCTLAIIRLDSTYFLGL